MSWRLGPRHGRLSMALALLPSLASLACATIGPPRREPLLDKLAVAELIITPVALEGAEATGRDRFRDRLAAEATGTAQRAALECQLARVLGDSGGTEAGTPRLSGRVSVPVGLPSGYSGWSAVFRKGRLAVAQLELRDHEGVLVAVAEAEVDWREGDWTTGSAKTRRNRPARESLIRAVELVVERAVQQLVVQLQ